ncbi:hypothetical protein PHYBLDRAFT_188355 [Phycomyces blakesleeanus NRRL 1555(-)]|uniref:RING-type domain-containing protein n=1 Tax=Phycomyces blakesleeanus (strain ATCC 8743b / DSM 1359 / FGSC 10004 / NBRC 33097 / NRRL 1555) TaxID=763407 RepID=A0A163D6K3_PHYB8|nr:hypothetical protein PHYBLDRAFT_188355 [Phycomyces blakesleeanus NRRL 1555(-)]OAD69120.1 hypothetical protein PHYBLDRAFT_188355 [Phycomyces blakesleeanus NRRL 1555(-)]|eukprot:XP_018287160.1 hypothetical protein PHYBLDRAFT_188355 [Phycomyces blakesleeanus NRRL 1555(-)]
MGTINSKSTNSRSIQRQTQLANDTVDYGSLIPQGLYGIITQDYDANVVTKLMRLGKLAPFYKGLVDPPVFPLGQDQESLEQNLCLDKSKFKLLYTKTAECPICLLWYPACINYSRCCHQPICTECFLQLRRPLDTLSPVYCPFCVRSDFGVIHTPPEWSQYHIAFNDRHPGFGPRTEKWTKEKRVVLNLDDPDVVLVDQVRPHWQEEMADKLSKRRRHSSVLSGSGSTRRVVVRPRNRTMTAVSQRLQTYSAGYIEDLDLHGDAQVNNTNIRSNGNVNGNSNGNNNGNGRVDNYRQLDLEDLLILETIRRTHSN